MVQILVIINIFTIMEFLENILIPTKNDVVFLLLTLNKKIFAGASPIFKHVYDREMLVEEFILVTLLT